MNPQRKENITKFVTELLKKMELGEKEHGESTGGEVGEIEQELLDLVGWAFVRWERLQKKEEPEEPKHGTKYWFVNRFNMKGWHKWINDDEDKAHFKSSNCFWVESDCDNEILRRESMTGRIAEPKKRATIFRWDFEAKSVIPCNYDRTIYPEYIIGAIHRSNKDCKEWGKKYAKAFTNLNHQYE